jgi:nitrous oxidase accessory protein NosD
VCVIFIGLAGSASAHGGSTIVQPGESIQAAIDAARPGARIVVRAGTYAEQLTIQTDDIDLIGSGAVLVPPTPAVENTCSGLAGDGTQAGICVTGADVGLAQFVVEHRKVLSVGRPVKDVSITGFQVRGFSGEDIAVVGAQDARVAGNKLIDGGRYGFLTAGSTNTRVTANTVTSTTTLRFIGICMDNLAGVRVSNNRISGYNVALCVQTPFAEVRNNDVSASCIGVFVDPFIAGAKIDGNHIGATNPLCATGSAFGAFGIILDGAVNTEVHHNRIEGQTLGAPPNDLAVGIAVVDDPTTTPVAVASGNVVTGNKLSNNDHDLFVATVGTGNVIARNH